MSFSLLTTGSSAVFLADILYVQQLFTSSSSLAISPPHSPYLFFCLFCRLLLHLPLTDRLSHIQRLQTCSFPECSVEESSRTTLNKSSNQLCFSFLNPISWSVRGFLSTRTSIYLSLQLFHILLLSCLLCLIVELSPPVYVHHSSASIQTIALLDVSHISSLSAHPGIWQDTPITSWLQRNFHWNCLSLYYLIYSSRKVNICLDIHQDDSCGDWIYT